MNKSINKTPIINLLRLSTTLKNLTHIQGIKVFIVLFTLCTSTTYTAKAQNNSSVVTNKDVGHIEFNPETDNSDFHLCNERRIQEYYAINTRYKEGLKSIRQYWNPYLDQINELIHFDKGLITIRFIVNCQGETDRFRVFAVNENYKSLKLKKELKQIYIDITKGLDDWSSDRYKGKYYDSYFLISLKIEHGKVSDILP